MSIVTREPWEDDVFRAISTERHAVDEVKRLAAEIAVVARPIAHFGDGNCGEILRLVAEQLEIAGTRAPDERQAAPALPRGWRDLRESPARHRKLHAIAAHHNGWVCCYCSAELVDVCNPDGTEEDGYGRRLLRPDSTKRAATVEHIIPRSSGGSNAIQNTTLACMPCNARKNAQ